MIDRPRKALESSHDEAHRSTWATGRHVLNRPAQEPLGLSAGRAIGAQCWAADLSDDVTRFVRSRGGA